MDEQLTTPNAPPSPLSQILERVLSDPKAGGNGEKTPPSPDTVPQPQTGGQNPMADGLGALLSDPAFLQNLPRVISLLAPMMNAPQKQQEHPAAIPPAPSEHRDRLLLALKPFLSEDRQRAVDTILRLSRLGSVFTQLQSGGT